MEVLHASPHPDDELIGAPATLMSLRDAGHRIVNFACSLGGSRDEGRRRPELEEACRRAGFELVVSERPLEAAEVRGAADVRESAEERLAEELGAHLAARRFDLVVAPSPHDRHPTHELVGRSVRAAIEGRGERARLWMWAIWGALPFPTTIVSFGGPRLREIVFALEAHAGELARNDYARLVAARGREQRVVAPELVFGFGARGLDRTYAESTGEAVYDGGRWLLGAPRELDPHDPFPAPPGPDVGWWLRSESAADRLARSAPDPPSAGDVDAV